MGRVDVRRRSYLLLDRLSIGERQRFLGFDPYAGPRGQPVAVFILPRSRGARQHLAVLQDLSRFSNAFPSIVDYDQQSDRSVVVVKWVYGPTLSRYLHDIHEGRTPRISAVVAFHRIQTLVRNLRWWHQGHQIVHGDIKLENLVVTRNPGRFVLIDFGSAWRIEQTRWRDFGDGASRAYAAPELIADYRRAEFRSDQFSVSVVFYQLLTLKLPSATAPIQPPSELSPDRHRLPPAVWGGIDRLVMRGLAPAPDDRYPTPEAWLNDFDTVQMELKKPRRASPLNERLTQVIHWLVNRSSR